MLLTILFMLGRVALAAYFIDAGINHFKSTAALAGYAQSRGVGGSAKLLTLVSGVVLVLGGAGVLLGVVPRLALLALAVFLITAAIMIHHFWTDTDPQQKMGEKVNFTKNLALAAALLMALAIPLPWTWSLL
ncbi:DoxX family protein [Candidatus Wolfebacteria bacterium]|nr:DoxX family protein [Candidatus Wolfebacteria bacterium]